MNTFTILLTGAAGATLTYLANHRFRMGAVRASALLSLVVALIFYVFPNLLSSYLTTHIPLVFMGSSFIGMVSRKVMENIVLLVISGIIFSLIYLNSGQFFAGFGGALGTTACISVLVSAGLAAIQKSRPIKKVKQFRKRRKD
ncbi:hypothetical protein RM545_13990 [Zunongwangia sp. F260]|uniref:Uncharacterized protein n=1 Tax=Autumnicola lenta TaxID=3075593 RepID=A0ABU3CNE0_9FLAO|nr:hypothetical protein [Zunongwangia sp. F260]MDT0647806.1 hypothetical protein [Zunongwangia sp. F260]